MVDPVTVDGCPAEERIGYPSLESCSFTWLIDTERRRLQRIPRGVAPEMSAGIGTWVDYDHLEIDNERGCFLVALDERGTRSLRSWLHRDGWCPRCRRLPVEPASLETLRRLVDRWRPSPADQAEAAAGNTVPNPPRAAGRPFGGRRRRPAGESRA